MAVKERAARGGCVCGVLRVARARADIDVGPRRRCAAAVRSGCARRLGQHSLELGACDFTALFPPLPQEFDLILSTLIIGLHRLVLRDEAQLGLLVF